MSKEPDFLETPDWERRYRVGGTGTTGTRRATEYNEEHNYMDHVIAEYQKWKAQGESLRAQARQAMETRFRDLLTEAAGIAQEYHRDFGSTLKPPAQITAFRFRPTGAKALKKTAGAKTAATPAAKSVAKASPLEKKLAQARVKLEAAKAAGKPTKNFEDRIYEIEDEIRLANQG